MITKLPVDFLRADGEATPNGRLGWSQGLHDPQKDSDFGDHGDIMEIMEISWGYHGDIMEISWGYQAKASGYPTKHLRFHHFILQNE